MVNSETILHVGDIILVISTPIDVEAITIFFGKEIKMEWEQLNKELISRRILITKPELNGKTLSQLKIRNNFGANITRINRSGVDLVASPQLQLQMGDRVTIVGSELLLPCRESTWQLHETLESPEPDSYLYRYRFRMYSGKSSFRISRNPATCETRTGRRSAHRFYPD